MNTLRKYLARSRNRNNHRQTYHHKPTRRNTPDVHTPVPISLSLR